MLANSFNGRAQTFVGDKQEIESILKNIKKFSSSYMNADYEAIARAYTPDAKILPPGADIIVGYAAIKKRWTLPEGIKILLHKVNPTEITIVNNIAYDLGYYNGKTQRKDGSVVEWKGKYLIVWKKVEGEWKIYADAWNDIND
ncbi:nuclear transport factor 2 family protein [Fulvivirga sp.]